MIYGDVEFSDLFESKRHDLETKTDEHNRGIYGKKIPTKRTGASLLH